MDAIKALEMYSLFIVLPFVVSVVFCIYINFTKVGKKQVEKIIRSTLISPEALTNFDSETMKEKMDEIESRINEERELDKIIEHHRLMNLVKETNKKYNNTQSA